MLRALSISKSMMQTVLLITSLGVIAGLISGNQVFGIGRDYQAYTDFFERIKDFGWESLIGERFEIGFGFSSFLLVSIFSSEIVIYGILSAVSFIIKVYALRIIGCGFWIGIFFYLTRFFPLYEMSQLRVALGASLVMLSFVLEDRGSRKLALLMICAGITFHWVVIILLPFVFLDTNKRTLLSVFVLTLGLLATLKLFPSTYFSNAAQLFRTFQYYEIMGFGGADNINYFPVAIFLDLAIVIGGLYFWRFTSAIMKKILIAQIFSFAIFYALIEFPILAWRFHDIFAVLMTLYVSAAFGCCRTLRRSVVVYVVLSSALYTYMAFVKDPLFGIT